jgi:Na+(H+)/acetate symporter ActP
MTMDGHVTRADALRVSLVLLATVAGIIGMGMVFEGVMQESVVAVSRGLPFLLLGLWWAGRELGRSMALSRARRATDGGENRRPNGGEGRLRRNGS